MINKNMEMFMMVNQLALSCGKMETGCFIRLFLMKMLVITVIVKVSLS